MLEKLDGVDDDEGGYKRYIINIIEYSGNFVQPLQDLLSSIKVHGTEFTASDFLQAFSLVGQFVNLVVGKPISSYSLKPLSTLSKLNAGDSIAVKTWVGWWTFMIVTENHPNQDLKVVCYVSKNNSDCVHGEIEFLLGFQKSLSLQEVHLDIKSEDVYLVEYEATASLLPPKWPEVRLIAPCMDGV